MKVQYLNSVPRAGWSQRSTLVRLFLFLALASGASFFFNEAQAAGGKDVKFKDTTLELQDGDRLVISGLRGTVRCLEPNGAGGGATLASGAGAAPHDVTSAPGAASTVPTSASTEPLQVTLRGRKSLSEKGLAQWGEKFDAFSLQTRRTGHTVFVEVKGPRGQADLADWTAANSPEMAIEVSLAGQQVVPIEVSLHDGLIQVQGWRAPMALSAVQGSIKTTETQGELQLQLQRGDLHVSQHHGSLDVDSFGAKLIADHVDGDIHLDNFSGESNLKDVTGNVFVRTHSGGTNVVDSSGAIDFELGRGGLTVTKFDGPVRGQTETAPVFAKLEGESDVNIESVQGPVAVRLPASSGASIRLQSDTGNLSAPEEIHALQTATSKLATGRMKGNGPKGVVTIKSKTASIRVRPDSSQSSAPMPASTSQSSESESDGANE